MSQGEEISELADLPEQGEEPWDRSVDMAHHTVDWKEASAQVSVRNYPYRAWGLLRPSGMNIFNGWRVRQKHVHVPS